MSVSNIKIFNLKGGKVNNVIDRAVKTFLERTVHNSVSAKIMQVANLKMVSQLVCFQFFICLAFFKFTYRVACK